METSEREGGGWENSGRSQIRGFRIGKRIKSVTAARNTTKDLGFEIVQISIDESKPLLTVQIKPKHQADTFPSLIDSGATANFISPNLVETLKIPKIALPNPQNIRMLDGSIPKTGKVWHKVHLEFQCQGVPTFAEFLVCPIGSNQAILGMPWLKDQNPSINWREQTLTLSETIQIASEEEADKDPLQGLPSIYHEFSRVFGEKEFKVLPPHRTYVLKCWVSALVCNPASMCASCTHLNCHFHPNLFPIFHVFILTVRTVSPAPRILPPCPFAVSCKRL
jgi:hypothetical protein